MLIHRELGNKYGAERCQGYPSKLEAAVGATLKIRLRVGEIRNVKRQVSVRLGNRFWKCDFTYEENGETVFCEAKGMQQREWIWIKEMWGLVGPGKLVIWGGSYQRPQTIETIERGPYASKI
jgi:hypothetical protein